MKYIIIGLGHFGASLAEKLTKLGNEVIGIDVDMDKVDAFKEKISHTIQLDATDETTVTGLPLKDTDIVIVAIGENEGANIMSSALFKNLEVKRLITRAINPLHEKVLQAIGVDDIVSPEEETADRWAKKLSLKKVIDSFELNDKYSIIEAELPSKYNGKTIRESDFRGKYGLLVLTTMKQVQKESKVGKTVKELKIQEVATADTTLEDGDILVLYGKNSDLEDFLKQ
ncbi:MAG: TrkA family potassium uptake protein [Cyclobacteriaceae bacterium]|nr:TrkA family potassium uptake protein [Cyclobacteriaceae bacterium]MCH8515358.1 TrkA family potassium uptake protein [Cyclobacteriaceae bacterium]